MRQCSGSQVSSLLNRFLEVSRCLCTSKYPSHRSQTSTLYNLLLLVDVWRWLSVFILLLRWWWILLLRWWWISVCRRSRHTKLLVRWLSDYHMSWRRCATASTATAGNDRYDDTNEHDYWDHDRCNDSTSDLGNNRTHWIFGIALVIFTAVSIQTGEYASPVVAEGTRFSVTSFENGEKNDCN